MCEPLKLLEQSTNISGILTTQYTTLYLIKTIAIGSYLVEVLDKNGVDVKASFTMKLNVPIIIRKEPTDKIRAQNVFYTPVSVG